MGRLYGVILSRLSSASNSPAASHTAQSERSAHRNAPKLVHSPSNWAFRVKPCGRRRARLCIKGYEQVPGVDYSDTYSPVVNIASLRALIAVAAAEDFECATFDVNTAFLNSDIDTDIYMYVPDGFKETKGDIICKLIKSLYGLKQSSNLWYNKLKKVLGELGLKPLKKEPCIFKNSDNTLFIGLHIDDGFVVGKIDKIDSFFKNLKGHFDVKIDMQENMTFLGMQTS